MMGPTSRFIQHKQQVVHVLKHAKLVACQLARPRQDRCYRKRSTNVIEQHREPRTKIMRALIPPKIKAIVRENFTVNVKLKPPSEGRINSHVVVAVGYVKAEQVT